MQIIVCPDEISYGFSEEFGAFIRVKESTTGTVINLDLSGPMLHELKTALADVDTSEVEPYSHDTHFRDHDMS